MKLTRAIATNIGSAVFDVAFVAVVSLIPLLLARLTPLIRHEELNLPRGWLWQLLTNGQLAFYALGTLAAIALVVYKGESLPKFLRTAFGALTLFIILFVAYLIGVDPTMQYAPLTFVGVTSLWIYLLTQLMALAVTAFDRPSLGAVITAGNEGANETSADLAGRKKKAK
jgi:hypothetical protein